MTTLRIWQFGHWLYSHGFVLPSKGVRFFLLVMFGCSIAMEVKPGERTQLPHMGRGFGVHAQTRLGNDLALYPHSNLSTNVPIGSDRYMVIGDRVTICSYSFLIGDIHVGDDAVIGAHAVVTKDVPAGAIVGGNPARVLNMNGREYNAKRMRRELPDQTSVPIPAAQEIS